MGTWGLQPPQPEESIDGFGAAAITGDVRRARIASKLSNRGPALKCLVGWCIVPFNIYEELLFVVCWPNEKCDKPWILSGFLRNKRKESCSEVGEPFLFYLQVINCRWTFLQLRRLFLQCLHHPTHFSKLRNLASSLTVQFVAHSQHSARMLNALIYLVKQGLN